MSGEKDLDSVPSYLQDAVSKEVSKREAEKTAKLTEKIREDMRFEEINAKITSSLTDEQIEALNKEMDGFGSNVSKTERLEKASKILGFFPKDSQDLKRTAYRAAMTMPQAGDTPTNKPKTDTERILELERIRKG